MKFNIISRREEFLKLYPNTEIDDGGVLLICPSLLGGFCLLW